MLHLKNFWYVIAESDELTAKEPLSRQLLNQHLVLYRGSDGKPIIMLDRCMHRCGKLSQGKVSNGQLQCPYHGWVYGDHGKVIAIPTEGNHAAKNLCHRAFASIEQEGYIYVCLEPHPEIRTPYSLPVYKKKGWKSIRFQHYFNNNVTNCVENFIDVPHTAFVHHGIFRSVQGRPIRTLIERKNGTVTIDYLDESSNLGSMSWFLNPTNGKVIHIDHFIMPNITHVVYRLPSGWEYMITSQSIPLKNNQTLVYTDISYQFGIWTHLATWFVRRQAKKVIAQDQKVLADQQEIIEKMGGSFLNMPCDLIHVMISEIREALEQGIDPRTLANKSKEITFYV